MMIRKLLGNLWFWVIGAFVLVILAWTLTIIYANKHRAEPLQEGEVLERQTPESIE